MKKNIRGSEWIKCDLHIHTPYSIEHHYGDGEQEETWEKFISDLESLPKEFKIIGINDYLFIDGYRKVLEYRKKGRLANIDLVLPVIELRIDKFGSLSSEDPFKRVNFHIIFSDKLGADIIEAQFLNALSSSYTLSSDCTSMDWNGLITRNSLIDLGSKLIKSSDGKLKGNPLRIGFNSLNIPYTELLTKLKNHHLKNKFLTAVGKAEWDAMRWESSPAEKKSVINNANFVFTASESPENHQKAKDKLTEQNVNNLLLDCSDAHCFSDRASEKDRIGNCFTWIKTNPTFEGLKYIIYEPEQRIKIQLHEPDFKEDKLIIDEVKFISDNNLFTPEPIRFNKNLNVIIGGKSSGKSILLYNIASTLETNGEVSSTNKYNFRENNPNFNFEVKTLSRITQKLYGDDNNSIIPNIKYISQNYLAKLAEPNENKKGAELLKYVRGLLLEDEEYKNHYQNFLSIVKSNDRKREDIIDNYFTIKSHISYKEKELKEKGSEEVLNKSLESNRKRISELKKGLGLTDEEIKKYNDLKLELENIETETIKIKNDYKRISDFNRDALNSLKELMNRKGLIEKSIEIDSLKNLFKSKYTFLENGIVNLEAFIDSYKIEDNKFVNDNLFKTLLIDYKKKKEILLKEIAPFIKNEKVKKEVSEIEKIIATDNKKLQSISQLKKEIKDNIEEVKKEKNKLFELYLENFKEYPKIISTLSERTKLLEEQNLEIKGSPKFNVRKFNKSMNNASDGRSFPTSLYKLFQEKENLIDFDSTNHLEQIKKIFSSIVEKNSFVLNSKTSKKNAIKTLLSDYFVDYWETIYDGDKMGEMSTGKASFVILMLIVGLSSSKAPILIDQPEDNLDNRSITKDLVKYLRDKKLERQIILVSHNPNVVVNADSENVIIAHQKGQNDKETSSPYIFDYINGAIENTKPLDINEKDLLKSMGIKEHIAEIVEGGEDAFKKREKKYGFKS